MYVNLNIQTYACFYYNEQIKTEILCEDFRDCKQDICNSRINQELEMWAHI